MFRVENETGALIFKKNQNVSIENLEKRLNALEDKCEQMEDEIKEIKAIEKLKVGEVHVR